MVSGEDSESSGVNRQTFVNAKLGTEIGNERFGGLVVNLVKPGGRAQRFVKPVLCLLQLIYKALVLREVFEACLGHGAEELDGVVEVLLPQIVVDAAEEVGNLGVPRPEQIVHDNLEVLQRLGQRGLNCECSDSPHRSPSAD